MRTYPCAVCGAEVREDEVVWARPDGTLDTDTGKPYCDACLPGVGA